MAGLKPEGVLGYLLGYIDSTLKGAGALKGEKGDVGPQGPQGPEGPAGPQGEKGDTGTTIANGVTYDNAQSGLSSTDVQEAIDEVSSNMTSLEDDSKIKNAVGTEFALFTSQGGIRTNKILGNTHKNDDGVITSSGDSGSIEIKEHGKNFIAYPYYSGTSLVTNGITFTANEDGSVTANGTATSNAYFRFANKNMYSLENGKTYAISRGKTKVICMYAQNSSGDFVVLKEDESVKFTCNDTWRYIGCYVPKDTTVTDERIYPMLVEVNEDGTYPTEYEPYRSSTVTIQLSEPLRAIGDIKDEITKDGIVRRIGTREYISGDELDSTIITDNTTTYYVLSTPTTEQLTNEQKVALNSLVSFKDKTYIETSDLYAKATLDLDYFNSDSGALTLQNENKLGKLEQTIIELGGTM